jgi:hypothetical protein
MRDVVVPTVMWHGGVTDRGNNGSAVMDYAENHNVFFGGPDCPGFADFNVLHHLDNAQTLSDAVR